MTQYIKYPAQGGTGTVTSVGLSAPGIFTVSGSPVTGNGTLALGLATELANLVWAGPTGGGAATPTFRSLVAADLPDVSGTYLVRANNLSDVANAATAATNLSLGTGNNAIFNGLTLSGLTANTVLVVNGSKVVISSGVSTTTLAFLDATSSIQTQLNGKQASGNYITALTGDVTASGSGSVASTLATVNSNVGSFTNSSITVNVKGLITAASSGTAPEVPLTFSTGLTRTVNTVTVNTSQNISTLSNLTSNGFVKTSGGTGALSIDTTTYLSGTVGIGSGGTGQTIKAAGFDALSPMSTGGDIIYGGASGTGTRLANGTSGQYLVSGGGTAAPAWTTLQITNFVSFTMTITATTTNPTKGTVTEFAYWRRVGDCMEIQYSLNQTVAGSAGSGTYLFLIPNSQSIDTSKVFVSTVKGVSAVGFGQVSESSATVNSIAIVQAYDSTHLSVVATSAAAAGASLVQGSGAFGLGNASAQWAWSVKIPISGWSI